MSVLFFLMLTLAITLTIHAYPLYYHAIDTFKLVEVTGVAKEQLIKNYHILMQYLTFPWVKELSMPDFPSSFSGLFHFYEVKKLFLLNAGILLLTLVPSFFILRNYFKDRRYNELKNFFKVGMWLPVVFGFTMALGFDRFFVLFHKLFFNNDDWLFNPATDPIILALPEGFFQWCFFLFFALFEGIMIFGFFYTRMKDKRNFN